ncbi:MAG: hypothetical protein K6T34_06690 [Thermoflavifilum sp.]|nr:hypothetical protein [Thermoflavifilum sp.]
MIKLSADMRVAELKMQLQQLTGCQVEIYHHYQPAAPDAPLHVLGFQMPEGSGKIFHLFIDGTWRVRDLETWFASECHLLVDIQLSYPFPSSGKHIRLYQLRNLHDSC